MTLVAVRRPSDNRSEIRRQKMVARPFVIVTAASILALTGSISRSGAVTPRAATGPASHSKASWTFTGGWVANDGGTYYLRQVGRSVYWTGLSGTPGTPTFGTAFTNVFVGAWYDDRTIRGRWVDVPRGSILGSGTLTLRYLSSCRIVKTGETGSGFGASTWSRAC
jgi:hypothetical protein